MALSFTSARFCRHLFLLGVVLLITFLGSSVKAQFPDLVVRVGDTTGTSGETNSVISVTLDNFFDEICGFELWLQLDRDDIMEFQTNLDTIIDTSWWACNQFSGQVCIDSTALLPEDSAMADFFNIDSTEQLLGNFDTTGTLISGWDFVTSSSVSGTGADIRVTGQASQLGGNTPGIAPQQGGVLFRLLGDIFSIPDTLTDRTVRIIPQTFLEFYNMSRCDGTSIGILTLFVEDTNFFHCVSWNPDSSVCLAYIQVPGEPYDSIDVFLDTVAVFDSSKVFLFPGSVTVLTAQCGNLDCDSGDNVDIADLTLLIDHLFISFPPLCAPQGAANIDCDPNNNIDIADLTVLIDHLFINFMPLCCDN